MVDSIIINTDHIGFTCHSLKLLYLPKERDQRCKILSIAMRDSIAMSFNSNSPLRVPQDCTKV